MTNRKLTIDITTEDSKESFHAVLTLPPSDVALLYALLEYTSILGNLPVVREAIVNHDCENTPCEGCEFREISTKWTMWLFENA